jgi:cytochrome c553
MQISKRLWAFGVTLALGTGCNQPEAQPSAEVVQAAAPAPTATPAPPPDPASEAKNIFSTRCAACHGAEGKGDGAGAAALDPKPRAFTESAWQDSVDDAYLKKVIVEGGASVQKSVAMPGNPDLTAKQDVLLELVKHIRSFKQ